MSVPTNSDHRVAAKFKELGNVEFKNCNWQNALTHYTKALCTLPDSNSSEVELLRYQLRLNRSKTFFNLNENALAYAEICGSIDMEIKTVKHFVYLLKLLRYVRLKTNFDYIVDLMMNFINEHKNDLDEKERTAAVNECKELDAQFYISQHTISESKITYRFNLDLFQQMHSKQIDTDFRINSLDIFTSIPTGHLRNMFIKYVNQHIGYGSFANKNVAKNEKIIQEPAILFASLNSTECEHCGKFVQANSVISLRGEAWKFCSIVCQANALALYQDFMQRKHWNYTFFKQKLREANCRSIFPRLHLLLIKLMAMALSHNLINPIYMTQLAQLAPNFRFLKSNLPLLDRMNSYIELLDVMNFSEHERRRFDFATFDYLTAILLNNCFEVANNKNSPYADGIGLFTTCSFVNHSCEPNAKFEFDGSAVLKLTAKENISVGQQITISYIDETMSKDARMHALKHYSFECNCIKCKHEF